MEDKYAAQTNFLSVENVNNFYRQIIEQGYIGEGLTQQITEKISPDTEPEISRSVDRSRTSSRRGSVRSERSTGAVP